MHYMIVGTFREGETEAMVNELKRLKPLYIREFKMFEIDTNIANEPYVERTMKSWFKRDTSSAHKLFLKTVGLAIKLFLFLKYRHSYKIDWWVERMVNHGYMFKISRKLHKNEIELGEMV